MGAKHRNVDTFRFGETPERHLATGIEFVVILDDDSSIHSLGGDMAELTRHQSTDLLRQNSQEHLAEVLDLHRTNGSVADLYFLANICFDLPDTADGEGVRFVLWQPVAEFLRFGFDVEVQELLFEGHLAIVFVEHDAARFAKRISSEIETLRRTAPRTLISSGPEVLLQLVDGLVGNPELEPRAAEKLLRMARAYRTAIRAGDHSDLPYLRAQLSEMASSAVEDDIRRCIDLLRRADAERTWPANSSARLSERSLARDWLDAEEDAAWSHL